MQRLFGLQLDAAEFFIIIILIFSVRIGQKAVAQIVRAPVP
jgi:hypothetical protein